MANKTIHKIIVRNGEPMQVDQQILLWRKYRKSKMQRVEKYGKRTEPKYSSVKAALESVYNAPECPRIDDQEAGKGVPRIVNPFAPQDEE